MIRLHEALSPDTEQSHVVDGPLIRPEVISKRSASALGSVKLTTPVTARITGALGLILIAGTLAWLCLGQYTRRVHVSGTLVPVGGLAPIASSSPGLITKILVEEGETIRPGTPLLMITQEESAASTGDTRRTISDALKESQTSLASDIQLTSRIAEDQKRSLEDDHASLERQLTQIDAQVALWRESTDRQGAILDKIHNKMASGIVSDVQLQEMQSQQDTARAQVSSLLRDRLQVRQQLTDNEAQQRQTPLDAQQKRSDFQRKILDAKQLLVQSEAARLVVIRSESGGTVANILVHSGQSVPAGRELLTIVPAESQLRAELLVPSKALGFLSIGNKVVLHYAAFSYQKFGSADGCVQRISQSSLRPDELDEGSAGTKDAEPMYRVIVSLNRQTVSAYGKERSLSPGMSLDADILVDKRSMLEWVFEPLYGMAKR